MSQNKQTTYDLQYFDPYHSSFTFQTKRFKLLNDTIELGGMFCFVNYQSFIEKSKCMSIHIHNIVPKFVVVISFSVNKMNLVENYKKIKF